MGYVAIALSAQLAFTSFIEAKRYQDQLAFYNAAATELETRLSWWHSLSSIQMANPMKYAELVAAMEKIKKAETALINPSGTALFRRGDHPTFNLTEFKSDVADAIQKDGHVKFKQGWVEKHSVFFVQYEDWLAKQGFFEVRTAKYQQKYASLSLQNGEIE